jgi:hypothetical protein
MDTRDQLAPVLRDLFDALQVYSSWLGELHKPGTGTSGTGQAALQSVIDLRRDHFPHLSHELTELLIVHTQLIQFVFERELLALRGQAPSDLALLNGLVQRQLAAVEAMRFGAAPLQPIQTRGDTRPRHAADMPAKPNGDAAPLGK